MTVRLRNMNDVYALLSRKLHWRRFKLSEADLKQFVGLKDLKSPKR